MADNEQECQRRKRAKKPLDAAQLRDLALSYVARYATSAAKLERYLKRKLRERGWEDEENPPDIAGLTARYSELGYIDDKGFARSKSAILLRRGYGARRVGQVLGQDGIAPEIRDEVAPGEAELRHAALAMAQKRRFGPFGVQALDRDKREKQVAAMLRAGHTLDFARQMVDAASVEAAEEWAHELDEEESRDDHW
ncbi:regulatory protein RecX [Alteraurantiacibacter aquimixticola]|uniref:Uncharacterized protein n=1 Tax=Alteraurantiacibacter aquimixticola TaxID=2489173 RepID=A0A4T3EY25_9SPHN|nr:RecX family transcriptional regulator [Alteraurantiacibacter aquimixticola]TIX49548.1 hypothetical protein E5222_11935 [Alteraurantiacibacter aquimixticola]